jgi:excisionase family DNA binding protein
MDAHPVSSPATAAGIIVIGTPEFRTLLSELMAEQTRTIAQMVTAQQQPATTDVNEYLTRREAAAFLRVSLHTLQSRLRDKTLPFVRIGRRVLVPKSAVTQFAQ